MFQFIKELSVQLESELNNVGSEINTIKGYQRCISLVVECMRQLRTFIATEPFPDKLSEIYFFKQLVPFFYCKYFYFVAMRNTALERRNNDHAGFINYLESEKEKIAGFFKKYHKLHLYYHSGEEDRDGWYTRRQRSRVKAEYYCKASIVTGNLLAFEEYRKFICNELGTGTSIAPKNIKMKLSKSEAAEFIMTLYEDGIVFIDEKLATIKQITEMFGFYFPFDLDDIIEVDGRNRMRIKDINPLLHRWLGSYERRIKRLG